MVSSPHFLLLGNGALVPLVTASLPTTFAAMLLFAVIVFARAGTLATTPGAAVAPDGAR
jgi:hypothetical protein